MHRETHVSVKKGSSCDATPSTRDDEETETFFSFSPTCSKRSAEINLSSPFLREESVFSGKDPVYLKSLISFS